MNDHIKTLKRLDACHSAIAWIKSQDNIKTAWDTCQRGDWMLWIASRLGIPRERLVLAACDCAELSLKYVTPEEPRPRIAIATARRWALGRETIANVRVAADAAYAAADAAAYAAAYAADAADAADAAYDAARAAFDDADDAAFAADAVHIAFDAADAAAYASAYAADAVHAANDAVYAVRATGYAARAAAYAAAHAERLSILSRCADNVRLHISFSDIETALNNHGATL